jgi:hypothetical protein
MGRFAGYLESSQRERHKHEKANNDRAFVPARFFKGSARGRLLFERAKEHSPMSKKTTKHTTQMFTSYPRLDNQTANKRFAESVKPKDCGDNAHVQDFLRIMDNVTQARSFSISDVLYVSQPYDIPAPELKNLFRQWAEKMTQLGKLETVVGCYDEPVFILV